MSDSIGLARPVCLVGLYYCTASFALALAAALAAAACCACIGPRMSGKSSPLCWRQRKSAHYTLRVLSATNTLKGKNFFHSRLQLSCPSQKVASLKSNTNNLSLELFIIISLN